MNTQFWQSLWMDVFPSALKLTLAIAVLSGTDNTVVTTFDAQTGHQSYQSRLLSGSPLGLEILSPDFPGDNTRDIVTLSSDGHVRRFHAQGLAWETTSSKCPASVLTNLSIKGTPHFIATSLSKIFIVYLVPHGKAYSITVTTLDSVSGNIIDTTHLSASVLSAADVRVVGSHSSSPLVVWHEYTTSRSQGTLKANVLGSKSINTLSTEVSLRTHSYISMNLLPSQLWHPIRALHSPTFSSHSSPPLHPPHKSTTSTSPQAQSSLHTPFQKVHWDPIP